MCRYGEQLLKIKMHTHMCARMYTSVEQNLFMPVYYEQYSKERFCVLRVPKWCRKRKLCPARWLWKHSLGDKDSVK